MLFLPTDVVSEILSRLQVKPLLRFRSVCKIWCDLIDSDYFVKSHLHRSIETKTNRQIIRRTYIVNFVDAMSLDSLDVAEELEYPLVTDKCSGLVSCNGLLLSWRYAHDITVSNPSTRKCQTLAPPEDNARGYRVHRLFLWYDAVNDDYKVVRLSNLKYLDDLMWDSQVYSLKSNSWRTIKDFPYEILGNLGKEIILVHNALNFVVDINFEEEHHFGYVAAFDLATEETRLVSLPDFGGSSHVYMDLAALEGCLCVVAYKDIADSDREFLGVWVMKDYGVGDSWNKLLSPAQVSVMESFYKVVPLAYSKNGCELLLLQDDRKTIWFDLENNAARKVEVCSLSICFQTQVFVQSLVQLGYGGRKTNPKKQSKQDTDKKRQKKTGMKRHRGVIEP